MVDLEKVDIESSRVDQATGKTVPNVAKAAVISKASQGPGRRRRRIFIAALSYQDISVRWKGFGVPPPKVPVWVMKPCARLAFHGD